jgi:protein-disulfide isomerase
VKSYLPSRLTLPVNEREHIRGNVNARVTLVEYGDYECPTYSVSFASDFDILTSVIKKTSSNLIVVHRESP